jgi:hypothetical protein
MVTVVLEGDVSYGRQPDGSDTLFYFATPTPGTTNNLNLHGSNFSRADSVLFSIGGGPAIPWCKHSSLSSPVATDQIYYTTNGSIPTHESTLYTAPIPVFADRVLKARTYREGALPGPVVTNSYFVTRLHDFPTVSITTDPANLWDHNTGIYVKGPYAAEPNSPFFGANFWQDWEKPAQLEVYTKDGKKAINQGVGIKIFGAYSRANDQKSLAVFARNNYGAGKFRYPFFKDKPITTFESIVLRNAGNDDSSCHFRDGLISSIARNMDIDRLAFQPAAAYINGEYWGILNIREKINEHYLASNHSFSTTDLDLLGNRLEVLNGTINDYRGSHVIGGKQQPSNSSQLSGCIKPHRCQQLHPISIAPNISWEIPTGREITLNTGELIPLKANGVGFYLIRISLSTCTIRPMTSTP